MLEAMYFFFWRSKSDAKRLDPIRQANGAYEAAGRPARAQRARKARGADPKMKLAKMFTPSGWLLGPPVVPFYLFLAEGSPTTIGYRKKRYPYSILSTGGPRLQRETKRTPFILVFFVFVCRETFFEVCCKTPLFAYGLI